MSVQPRKLVRFEDRSGEHHGTMPKLTPLVLLVFRPLIHVVFLLYIGVTGIGLLCL